MGLIDLLVNSGNGDLLKQIGQKAGIDERTSRDLLSILGSSMLGQVKGRVESSNHDSTALEGLIQDSKYADILDSPSYHYNDTKMKDNGNDLLKYITGSKEGSREVASQVAKKTGLSSSIIKSLLPIIAPMIIGSLGKGLMGGGNKKSSSSGLLGMLDFDNDGSVIDDVAGLAMKYLL